MPRKTFKLSPTLMLYFSGNVVPIQVLDEETLNQKQSSLLLYYSCKPQLAQTILSEEGMTEALEGKLLISILAGVTIRQLTSWVLPSTRVVRAMPNTPCKVCHLNLFLTYAKKKVHTLLIILTFFHFSFIP